MDLMIRIVFMITGQKNLFLSRRQMGDSCVIIRAGIGYHGKRDSMKSFSWMSSDKYKHLIDIFIEYQVQYQDEQIEKYTMYIHCRRRL